MWSRGERSRKGSVYAKDREFKCVCAKEREGEMVCVCVCGSVCGVWVKEGELEGEGVCGQCV